MPPRSPPNGTHCGERRYQGFIESARFILGALRACYARNAHQSLSDRHVELCSRVGEIIEARERQARGAHGIDRQQYAVLASDEPERRVTRGLAVPLAVP